MQPWNMVQYPAYTKPVLPEREKFAVDTAASEVTITFAPTPPNVAESFFFVANPQSIPDPITYHAGSDGDSAAVVFPRRVISQTFTFVDGPRVETTFLPAWDAVYPNFHHVPQYPVYEGGINSGFQISQAEDRPPVFHGDQTMITFDFAVISQTFVMDPNAEPEPPIEQPLVTMDSWYQPWSEPVRIEHNQAVFEPPHAEVIEALVHHTSIGRWPPTEVNRVPTSVKRPFLREVRRPDRLK